MINGNENEAANENRSYINRPTIIHKLFVCNSSFHAK